MLYGKLKHIAAMLLYILLVGVCKAVDPGAPALFGRSQTAETQKTVDVSFRDRAKTLYSALMHSKVYFVFELLQLAVTKAFSMCICSC